MKTFFFLLLSLFLTCLKPLVHFCKSNNFYGERVLEYKQFEKVATDKERERQITCTRHACEPEINISFGDTTRIQPVDYRLYKKVKNRSLIAVILGGLGVFTFMFVGGIVFGIIGLIFALSALRKAKKIPYTFKRATLAKTALVVCILAILASLSFGFSLYLINVVLF